jgi:cysteine synthase
VIGADGPYAVEGIGGSEAPENLHRAVIDGAERVRKFLATTTSNFWILR